jgi:hypothetical protein
MADSDHSTTWTVFRQDDAGNEFVVETGLDQQAAEQLVLEFESRGHKQIYWARRDTPSSTGPAR